MKYAIQFLVAIAAFCGVSQVAFASVQIGLNPSLGDTVNFAGGAFRQGIGGPFLGTDSSTSQSWYTFCVEADGSAENINLGSNYRVVGLADYVATATGNVVTDAAKYLYYAYGHDLLAGLFTAAGLGAYTGTVPQNAMVQTAIWSLVTKGTNTASDHTVYTPAYGTNGAGHWLDITDSGLISGGYTFANVMSLRGAAITAIGNATNLANAARIRILNPDDTYPASGGQAQSMLYEVPEPATIAIWSVLGLCVCVLGRRVYG